MTEVENNDGNEMGGDGMGCYVWMIWIGKGEMNGWIIGRIGKGKFIRCEGEIYRVLILLPMLLISDDDDLRVESGEWRIF